MVPELGELGYFVSSPLSSGTRLDEFQKRLCTKALFLILPRFVPEFGGLGYFTKHPSTISSGTNLGNLKRG